jgi:hypothetical protein
VERLPSPHVQVKKKDEGGRKGGFGFLLLGVIITPRLGVLGVIIAPTLLLLLLGGMKGPLVLSLQQKMKENTHTNHGILYT